MSVQRPDPDELLRRVQAEEERASQGHLKIFFGAAPGVGKTYTMLEQAQVAVGEGIDVVVGVAETHGRHETEVLLEGLEILPRRSVTYRGRTFDEFNIDAALARRPGLLLVDELAHTNMPGQRHDKRWQDVMELVAAGVDVYTTLNVQHLESLNDIVAQITGIRPRETVPDAVFERADEVELVDLPPGALLQRLREGKVYIPEQARSAASNFFRKGNLLALRELALRLTAERVDVDMREYREQEGIVETWAAAERILVCVGPGPGGTMLVRTGRRMAAGLRADWVAVNVQRPSGRPPDADVRARIDQNLRLAESLGAEVAMLSGERMSAEVLAYARSRNVTRIIVGKPTHPRWRDRVFGSFLDELIRGSGDIEVHVISGPPPTPSGALPQMPVPHSPARDYVMAAGVVALVTIANLLFWGRLRITDIVMVYLLGMAFVATRSGRGPSAFAALASVILLDFLFVPPRFSLAVHDVRYLTTFAVMLAIGLLIADLNHRVRIQAGAARERERRTAAVLTLTRELAAGRSLDALAAAAARNIEDAVGAPAAVLVPEGAQGDGTLLRLAGKYQPSEHELTVARWALDHGEAAGRGTDTLPGSTGLFVPMISTARTLGVVGVALAGGHPLDVAQTHLLEALAQQTAIAIERVVLAEEAEKADIRAEKESLRSSLLSSVSHDLRTPLASITGAASSLVEDVANMPAESRDELLLTIYEEAQRLNRLVSNLLDMTRLESGGLVAHKEWTPFEEVVGSALNRLDIVLKDRTVNVDIPDDLPLASIDGLLIEQVLANLLENAVKYTPPKSPVDVSARVDDGTFVIDVADRGPGIPERMRDRIFDAFYRLTPNIDLSVGLGLAISRGIVTAHGGSIVALERPGGGSIFRISLPQPEAQPEMPGEAGERERVAEETKE